MVSVLVGVSALDYLRVFVKVMHIIMSVRVSVGDGRVNVAVNVPFMENKPHTGCHRQESRQYYPFVPIFKDEQRN